MGNSCSSSKGSYSTSTANPWIESALPPPTSTLQQPSIPALHEGSILGSAHAGNGNTSNNSSSRVLTCGEDKRIALFDWEHPTDRVYFEGHGRPVNQVLCKNELVWSISRDLSLKCWDLNSAKCLHTVEEAHSLNLSSITVNEEGTNVASGSRDYSVKVWDVEKLGTALNQYKLPRNIVTCLQFGKGSSNGDGKHLLYQGSEDLAVRVWDIRQPDNQSAPSKVFSQYVYFPLCMDIHDNTMVTGTKGFNSVGCEVKVWDVRNSAQPVHNLTGHSQDVTDCCLFNDMRIVSISKDGTIGMFDALSGETIKWSNVGMGGRHVFTSLAKNFHTNVSTGDVQMLSVSTFDGALHRIQVGGTDDLGDNLLAIKFSTSAHYNDDEE